MTESVSIGKPSIVRSLAAAVYLVWGTVLFAILAISTSWLTSSGRLFSFWARMWSRGWLLAAGVRLVVERESELTPESGYVFMANHQSALDIPVLLATLPVPTRFLAKRELFQIPFLSLGLKAGGFIPVDRTVRSRARETVREAAKRLAEGNSILLFPEETRSLDGTLLPFKRGGFLIAGKSGTPIVPVGVEGTGRVQRPKRLRIAPGTVRVRYGEPLDPSRFEADGKGRLLDTVRGEIGRLAGYPAKVDL